MIETYLTVLAILFILKIFMDASLVVKRKKMPWKKVIPRITSRFSKNTKLLLYLSVVWLIVFFFQFIRAFVLTGFKSLTFL